MNIRFILVFALLFTPYLTHAILQIKHEGYTYRFTGDTLERLKTDSKNVLWTDYIGVPDSFIIYQSYGYALDVADQSVRIIDLSSLCSVRTLRMVDQPKNTLIIKNDFGYIPSSKSPKIYTIHFPDNHWYSQGVIHGNFGYVPDERGNVVVLDLKNKTYYKSLGIPYQNQQTFFADKIGYFYLGPKRYNIIDLETHTCLGEVTLGEIQSVEDDFIRCGKTQIPVYPSLKSFRQMKKLGMLDLYVHHSPNALIIGFYETKVDPEKPSLFEYLPDDLLVLILKDLRPVDAAKLFTTFKYPKARLKKPLIKRFYEQKVYLSLFQEAWLRKTLEAQRIISFCILLDDPLITLLTRSMSHALTHVQAGRIGYFVRSLELSDNLIWTSAPNTEAILEDAVWDENGSIYLMIKYLNANIPMRAELEFMHALQGNNPYARALMCFGHLNGVFGLTKSPLLATFYIAGADQKTLETLAKEHAKVPYR